MNGTMYAWSPILHSKGRVDIGEEVTAEKIGVDEDEFNSLIESGAIRLQKYPEDIKSGESPRQAQLRQVREAGENVESLGFTPTQADRMGSPAAGVTATSTAEVSRTKTDKDEDTGEENTEDEKKGWLRG